MFDQQLVTVWSAPNYCYRCGNLASILTVRGDGRKEFTVYGAAQENERDKGMQTRKMVGSPSPFFLSPVRLLMRTIMDRIRCHILCRHPASLPLLLHSGDLCKRGKHESYRFHHLKEILQEREALSFKSE